MKLKHLPTKRSLKKEVEDLRLLIRHLESDLRNTKADLYAVEGDLKQYKQENKRLWEIVAALTDKYSDNDKQSGFTCVGVTECPFD